MMKKISRIGTEGKESVELQGAKGQDERMGASERTGLS